MIDDLLMDEDDGKPPPGPALVVPEADPQLELTEMMYRRAARDFPGAYEVIFVDFLEEDPDREIFCNPERWQELMSWPRLPTLEEAKQWQEYADASAEAALWRARNPGETGP
jgi:hypothetical protein